VMCWRLNINRRQLQWLGPLHTWTLWPYRRKAERSNL
jgi:hypothetical protein